MRDDSHFDSKNQPQPVPAKVDRAPRQSVEPLLISGFTSIDHLTLLSRQGVIVDASKSGFLLHVDRTDLLPKKFKEALSISELEGDQVLLKIPKLNIEISGKITRTHRFNKTTYEIAVDFSEDAPEYWRECLLEFLPKTSDS